MENLKRNMDISEDMTEDYKHKIGDPKTELELYPNSPARLILNNILFPAKKETKNLIHKLPIYR